MKEKMFKVGQIVNTHGIKGEVRVKSFTEHEDRFHVGKKLYVFLPDETYEELEIKSSRTHQQYFLLSFTGHESIEDVETLKGAPVMIKEDQLKDLREGEYYVHDIIQCTMYTLDGEKLGKIVEVLSTGANDVWVVEQADGKEVLIPYIRDVVKDVNLKEKKVYIEVMEGLLD